MLMRHAKSSWTTDDDDHERPLSSRGRRDGSAAGRLLAERRIQPDLVLCSTARRARQTFDRTVSGGAAFGDVVYCDDLYAASPDELVAQIRGVGEDVDTLMVVGHNPGLVDLLTALAARTGDQKLWASIDDRFPTSAVAVVEFDGDWASVSDGAGRLVAYAVPRG
ncbi:histidine phosphatase family protein [Mariniluteicoccus flavus]